MIMYVMKPKRVSPALNSQLAFHFYSSYSEQLSEQPV